MKKSNNFEEVCVEKRFRFRLTDFETRFFVPRKPCSVCDISVGHPKRVRQVEPTFCRDSNPLYEFDHNYEFLIAQLIFDRQNNASQKVWTLVYLTEPVILGNFQNVPSWSSNPLICPLTPSPTNLTSNYLFGISLNT
jgi:hypothetical protein